MRRWRPSSRPASTDRGMRSALIAALMLCVWVEAATAAVTIRDLVGREVTLPAPPVRIVSLVPSATEILFALGVDDRLVGVTRFCDYPEAARRKPGVGDMLAPNLEAIAALKPDLVIATDEGN